MASPPGAEHTDVVVAVVGQLRPAAIDGAAVERGRHAELDALRPHRVVVVVALERDQIEARRPVAGERRPSDVAAQHGNLETERAHRVFELGDRFGGVVHRDDRGRGHAIGVRPVGIGDVAVVRTATRDAQLVVGELVGEQPFARIHEREVDAEFVEALRVQRGQRRRRAVERVARGPHPRARVLRPVRIGRIEQELALDRRPPVAVDHRRAADLGEVFEKHGRRLDGMRIGVDDRMVECLADARG